MNGKSVLRVLIWAIPALLILTTVAMLVYVVRPIAIDTSAYIAIYSTFSITILLGIAFAEEYFSKNNKKNQSTSTLCIVSVMVTFINTSPLLFVIPYDMNGRIIVIGTIVMAVLVIGIGIRNIIRSYYKSNYTDTRRKNLIDMAESQLTNPDYDEEFINVLWKINSDAQNWTLEKVQQAESMILRIDHNIQLSKKAQQSTGKTVNDLKEVISS